MIGVQLATEKDLADLQKQAQEMTRDAQTGIPRGFEA